MKNLDLIQLLELEIKSMKFTIPSHDCTDREQKATKTENPGAVDFMGTNAVNSGVYLCQLNAPEDIIKRFALTDLWVLSPGACQIFTGKFLEECLYFSRSWRTQLTWNEKCPNTLSALCLAVYHLPTKEAKEVRSMGEGYSLESQAHSKTKTHKIIENNFLHTVVSVLYY